MAEDQDAQVPQTEGAKILQEQVPGFEPWGAVTKKHEDPGQKNPFEVAESLMNSGKYDKVVILPWTYRADGQVDYTGAHLYVIPKEKPQE